MRRCTLEEVARLSGGRLVKGDPALSIDRLHTDTRSLHAGDCFVGRNQPRPERLQFFQGRASSGSVQRFHRVSNDGDLAMPLEQSLCGAFHAIFGDHAEDHVFCIRGQPVNERARVWIVEDVERLLFEYHLREAQDVARQGPR